MSESEESSSLRGIVSKDRAYPLMFSIVQVIHAPEPNISSLMPSLLSQTLTNIKLLLVVPIIGCIDAFDSRAPMVIDS